jgi:hypothetical protein
MLARAKTIEVIMRELVMNTEAVDNSEIAPSGIFTSDRGDQHEHMADYQFDVREEPIATESGLIIPDRRAIIRGDTNRVLGTVGSNYKVLSHADALDPILDRLKGKKIKTFKRVALTAGGAKMFANIYFPSQEINLATPDGGRDNCWPGITVVNSLDGTLKYALEATIYRLACTNGMRVPTTISGGKTTHSKNMSFDDMVDDIIGTVSDTDRFVTLQKWANNVMTPEAMGNMAEEIVSKKGSMFPARYLDQVKSEIERESQYGVVSVWDCTTHSTAFWNTTLSVARVSWNGLGCLMRIFSMFSARHSSRQ